MEAVNDHILLIKIAAGTGDDKTRVLLLGVKGAGKSTLMKYMTNGAVISDMGNQKFKVNIVSTPCLTFVGWNVGPDVFVDGYWSDYHAERSACLAWVVDASASQEELKASKVELFKVLQSDRLKGKPLCVIATHADVPDSLSVVKLSEILELHELRGSEYKVFRVTGTTGENLLEPLEWIARWNMERQFFTGAPFDPNTYTGTPHSGDNRKSNKRSTLDSSFMLSPKPQLTNIARQVSRGAAVPAAAMNSCCTIV